jgi:hypothetical protein
MARSSAQESPLSTRRPRTNAESQYPSNDPSAIDSMHRIAAPMIRRPVDHRNVSRTMPAALYTNVCTPPPPNVSRPATVQTHATLRLCSRAFRMTCLAKFSSLARASMHILVSRARFWLGRRFAACGRIRIADTASALETIPRLSYTDAGSQYHFRGCGAPTTFSLHATRFSDSGMDSVWKLVK